MIMWDRKDLKEKGKNAFRANRVACILAGFLLSLVGGSMSFPTASFNYETWESMDIPPEVIRLIISIIGTATILGFVLSIFICNPVLVGLKKFFYDNSYDQTAGLTKKNIGISFSDGNYTNIVAAMFTTELFTFFWSLLFLVPGIIKSLSWRLVPYIMAEEPQITGTEARFRSAQMMYGSKWNAFVLDLSFFGWILLGIVTLGIGNLVWTNPYHAATDAELYRALKGESAPAVNDLRSEGSNRDDLEVEFEMEDETAE
jgi:uncharacterized membrane protein